jgi:hypothetical protein
MKNLSILLAMYIIVTLPAFSQEMTDTLEVNGQSVRLNKNRNLTFDDLDFYLDLQNINKSVILNNDPNTQWLWTTYAISNTSKEPLSSELNFDNITTPLYLKFLEDSKFNPFRYALGMVQAGAMGYLAYKYIKKYGFLKK